MKFYGTLRHVNTWIKAVDKYTRESMEPTWNKNQFQWIIEDKIIGLLMQHILNWENNPANAPTRNKTEL